ncbi:hypothetical protein TNCV_4050341 [Trichonephila clavipes]|nr:hypothetical protein TNCV_4050341 [Trichonephila clavipes]
MALLHAIYGAADVDELTKPILALDKALAQRAFNCLEEAVRSFTTMWRKCRSSCAVTASKLTSLWICSAGHEFLLSDRKILLLEVR